MKLKYLVFIFVITLCSCAKRALPPSIDNFQADRYAGKWYEIARYENRFEIGLDNASGTYTIENPGRMEILNEAYNRKKQFWKTSKGFARLNKDPELGELRVTFLWPFFAAYRVLYIDNEYQHAIIGSDNFEFLWLISKFPTIDLETQKQLINIAEEFNYDTDKLIFPSQDINSCK